MTACFGPEQRIQDHFQDNVEHHEKITEIDSNVERKRRRTTRHDSDHERVHGMHSTSSNINQSDVISATRNEANSTQQDNQNTRNTSTVSATDVTTAGIDLNEEDDETENPSNSQSQSASTNLSHQRFDERSKLKHLLLRQDAEVGSQFQSYTNLLEMEILPPAKEDMESFQQPNYLDETYDQTRKLCCRYWIDVDQAELYLFLRFDVLPVRIVVNQMLMFIELLLIDLLRNGVVHLKETTDFQQLVNKQMQRRRQLGADVNLITVQRGWTLSLHNPLPMSEWGSKMKILTLEGRNIKDKRGIIASPSKEVITKLLQENESADKQGNDGPNNDDQPNYL